MSIVLWRARSNAKTRGPAVYSKSAHTVGLVRRFLAMGERCRAAMRVDGPTPAPLRAACDSQRIPPGKPSVPGGRDKLGLMHLGHHKAATLMLTNSETKPTLERSDSSELSVMQSQNARDLGLLVLLVLPWRVRHRLVRAGGAEKLPHARCWDSRTAFPVE
jgi:hypothetical protein